MKGGAFSILFFLFFCCFDVIQETISALKQAVKTFLGKDRLPLEFFSKGFDHEKGKPIIGHFDLPSKSRLLKAKLVVQDLHVVSEQQGEELA